MLNTVNVLVIFFSYVAIINIVAKFSGIAFKQKSVKYGIASRYNGFYSKYKRQTKIEDVK